MGRDGFTKLLHITYYSNIHIGYVHIDLFSYTKLVIGKPQYSLPVAENYPQQDVGG